jgi:hypothetical protein
LLTSAGQYGKYSTPVHRKETGRRPVDEGGTTQAVPCGPPFFYVHFWEHHVADTTIGQGLDRPGLVGWMIPAQKLPCAYTFAQLIVQGKPAMCVRQRPHRSKADCDWRIDDSFGRGASTIPVWKLPAFCGSAGNSRTPLQLVAPLRLGSLEQEEKSPDLA